MELTKSPNGIVETPVLLRLSGLAADPHPGADDPADDESHADEDDEMSGVFAQRKAGDGSLVDVGDQVMLDEVQEQTKDHDDHAESSQDRKRGRWERRDGKWIGQ
jgi:hypothetical protein